MIFVGFEIIHVSACSSLKVLLKTEYFLNGKKTSDLLNKLESPLIVARHQQTNSFEIKSDWLMPRVFMFMVLMMKICFLVEEKYSPSASEPSGVFIDLICSIFSVVATSSDSAFSS